ncbi:Pentatricopeptide repeat-containing protein, chloroplastic [Vitis vinifera]|uniref:Pentatricopeptide repeat-containing protein, chloroplastic n=1 Tax=Vitis vinifera TaxID=29760 RepID=A0A438F9T4_VITVI|nr:Pentatricopeptide repeat-containing protein, chloroplastic [Vitis vinifera]RVW65957.1 Pentatricopeptide repeat-containing protein, chloroplastic [Vitis vinifera]
MAIPNPCLVSLPRSHSLPTPNPNSITLNNDRYFANHPTLSLIDQCSETKQLKQIHAQMLPTGPFFDPFSTSRLITAAVLSPFPSLDYAQQVFDQIPHRNLYTWNTLIRAYASIASELEELFTGKAFHGMVIKVLLGSDVFILNSPIHFYAKCGELGGCPEEALELFREMERQNVKPNGITMVGVLAACSKKSDFEFGRWVHSYIERNRIGGSLTLINAMLDMYTKCGSVEDAKRLFDKMSQKDIVSWTTMLIGYAKIGEYDAAQGIFDAMPNQDTAAWNALIIAYEQCGGWIHVYIRKHGMKLNCHLITSLIDMYCLVMHGHGKDAIDFHAGLVEEGRTFFNQMELVYGVLPGVEHYACMIDILGQANLLEEAVELTEKMPMAPTASI